MVRAALVVTCLAVTVSTASAGVYLGMGIGTAADTGNNTKGLPGPEITTSGNGRSLRFLVGERIGHFSIEANLDHYGVLLDGGTFDAWALGGFLKYSVPIAGGFELYGKGGLARTYVTNNNNASQSAALNAQGDGWAVAAGLEWRLNLILAGCSVFVDYEYGSSTFNNDTTAAKYDATHGMAMLGATVSL